MKTYFLIFLGLNLIVISCVNDTPDTPNIQGHWSLVYGELNGKAAPGLEKIFFDFQKDSLRTNFTQSEMEETGSYSLKDSKIVQKTSEPIEYDIENATDTVLELTTALRGLDFKLVLKKDTLANATPPQLTQ